MQLQQNSALSPFRHRTFAIMWLAALISNIGTWMHSVGAGWLMTDLSPSALVIALVQTATTLPIFLFALPAGALADIFNRRTLLLLTNLLMMLAAAIFAYLVWQQQVTATSLLLFTFVLGAGAAFMAPAWQAIIPKMVSKADLPQAVALGGISINLSRAIGPMLAGVLISQYGLSSPFIVNTLTFIFIIAALWWWTYQSTQTQANLPPERIWSAMRLGLRYAMHSQPLRATIWHVLGFMFFANAFWGLLPIISKQQLAGDAGFFGILMGAIGIGAVIGGLLLPKLKQRFNANQLVMIGTIGTALVSGYFAMASHQLLAVVASLIFGLSWIFVLASVNVSAQQALPEWVRARGLAVFMMMFYGSMSLGAAFWGWLADTTSIDIAMIAAACGALIFILLSYRAELQQGRYMDLTPSMHWSLPIVHQDIDKDSGPVIVQIQYLIADSDRQAFVEAIQQLKPIRERDGAFAWGIYEDTERKGYFIEQFMEHDWHAHLRHHERVTHQDKLIQDKVTVFHQYNQGPQVSHYLACR